jgi:2-hydroxy-3-oxopropionate reductase
MAEKIGVIGLGVMGRPIAQNLMEAGYELVLYNRTIEKAEEIAGDEATVAGSSREVAEQSDIIITMLPAAPEVREVVAGEDGVLEGIKEGALLVDMSTISSTATEELGAQIKERGASMLDAPVPGGDPGEQGGTLQRAQEGTLQIMVGGSEEDYRARETAVRRVGREHRPRRPFGGGSDKDVAVSDLRL